MDRLNDLPPKNDTIKTPEEAAVLSQLFPISNNKDDNSNPLRGEVGQNNSPPPQPRINWKLLGIATILFFILSSPWIDMLFCKLPYCGESPVTISGLKTLLFMLVLIVVCMFY